MNSRRRFVNLVFLAVTCTVLSFAAEKPFSVIFLCPLENPFWKMESDFMAMAAKSLGVNLEIQTASNHIENVTMAKELLKRDKKPDYLIIVNEKLVAPAILDMAEKAGVKTLVINNDLTNEQKSSAGYPRGKYKLWLGSLVPANAEAGYLIAESLVDEAIKLQFPKLSIIAINGVSATPAFAERAEGLNRFIKENPRVNLARILNQTDNSVDAGYLKMKTVIGSSVAEANMVWCASDDLAIGAIKALREAGRSPGKDVVVSGLNWSETGLESIADGSLAASVGGHFMTGGWAIVMLYDYHHGVDFSTMAQHFTVPLKSFSVITKENLSRYKNKLGARNYASINFRMFSRSINTSLGSYDFSLPAVLASIK